MLNKVENTEKNRRRQQFFEKKRQTPSMTRHIQVQKNNTCIRCDKRRSSCTLRSKQVDATK